MAAPRGGIESPDADALKRDVQRTQDSLEAVHGTLGHVVDRLATIEAGIRSNPEPRAAAMPERADSAPQCAADRFVPLSLPCRFRTC